MSIDLHVHSTASDGTVAPEDLVVEAVLAGLSAIALSDHDSVEGVASALSAGQRTGMVVVPAVELSAAVHERDMHILGYRIDQTDAGLLERLAELRTERRDRAMRMIEALRAGGYDLDPSAVLDLAGHGAVGRAHIARALAATGIVDSMGAAFRELIGYDRPYYIPKPVVTPEECIGLIRAAGGVAVLAHPGISKVDEHLDRLVAAGLQGLEVWHSEHSAEDMARYERIARERGLLATGGSDFHGPQSSGGGRCLGCVDVPDSALDALLAAPTLH